MLHSVGHGGLGGEVDKILGRLGIRIAVASLVRSAGVRYCAGLVTKLNQVTLPYLTLPYE